MSDSRANASFPVKSTTTCGRNTLLAMRSRRDSRPASACWMSGCGTGYGAAELARRGAFGGGCRLAAEAIDYARAHYAAAECPLRSGLGDGASFRRRVLRSRHGLRSHRTSERLARTVARSARVLHAGWVFLVSTPNQLYYAESRGRMAESVSRSRIRIRGIPRPLWANSFRTCTILLQNRVEAFAFHRNQPAIRRIEVRIDATARSAGEAHFFVAVCAIGRSPELAAFSMFRARPTSCASGSITFVCSNRSWRRRKQWLEQSIAEHHALQQAHAKQTRTWRNRIAGRWSWKRAGKTAQERIVQLQDEAIANKGSRSGGGRICSEGRRARRRESPEDGVGD